MSKLGSALTLSSTAYLMKSFRTLGLREFKVEGREILLNALKEPSKRHGGVIVASGENESGAGALLEVGKLDKGKGRASDHPVVGEDGKPRRRGIVTGAHGAKVVQLSMKTLNFIVCNHNSVFDDPLMWSFTPNSSLFPFASPRHTSRNARWTLGDIMFTNPVLSKFFASGQVIETIRGGGVFQPAIDKAVKLLQEGEWIHIFPEGKVNQHKMNPPGGMFRFKWGVGRIIMDSEVMPEIIPMWLSGFDQIMNEYRGFPRPLPRPGGKVSVTIGEPITDAIRPFVERWRGIAAGEKGDLGVGGEWTNVRSHAEEEGISRNQEEDERQRTVRSRGVLAGGREEAVRMEITAAIQEEVRRLGERVEREEGRFERGEWSHSCRTG